MGYIKTSKSKGPSLNRFELVGDNENALSKSFAYILSMNSKFLKSFLKEINIDYSLKSFDATEILIQKTAEIDDGITDIEIIGPNLYLIIECKIGEATVSELQQKRYIERFKSNNKQSNVFCMITGTRNNIAYVPQNNLYKVENITWNDILYLITTEFEEKSSDDEKKCLIEFENFLSKGEFMKNQNEILIQDVADPVKIELFEKYHIYNQGDIRLVYPLYFAPYYPQTNTPSGINYLAQIKYARKCTKEEMIQELEELEDKRTSNYKLWKKGLENFQEEGVRCFYLLDEPVKINKSIMKSSDPNKAQGWIALMIPKNRCVSFTDFISHSALCIDDEE